MTAESNFVPDWACPPGDTITDILRQRAISVSDFAYQLGESVRATTDLLRGRRMVTPTLARRLSEICGGSAEYWITRDTQYQYDAERQESSLRTWARELPYKQMVDFGWLNEGELPNDKVVKCLRFFDVPNLSAWELRYGGIRDSVAFRRSPAFASKQAVVAAWLRQGEIEAQHVSCEVWDRARLADLVAEVRPLTRVKNPQSFVPKLRDLCATAGVAVVVVRAPSGCPVSGATRLISPTKAILQLSFRYLTDDQFWFTVFHELGHLVLHNSSELFLEGNARAETDEERQANQFAESVLVPPEYRNQLLQLSVNGFAIARFAKEVGVSAGVVLGQLQHEGKISPKHLNGLKVRYAWRE